MPRIAKKDTIFDRIFDMSLHIIISGDTNDSLFSYGDEPLLWYCESLRKWSEKITVYVLSLMVDYANSEYIFMYNDGIRHMA